MRSRAAGWQLHDFYTTLRVIPVYRVAWQDLHVAGSCASTCGNTIRSKSCFPRNSCCFTSLCGAAGSLLTGPRCAARSSCRPAWSSASRSLVCTATGADAAASPAWRCRLHSPFR